MSTHDCPSSAGLVQAGVCAEIRSFRASVVSTGPLSNEIIPPIRLIAYRVPGSKVHQPFFNAGQSQSLNAITEDDLSNLVRTNGNSHTVSPLVGIQSGLVRARASGANIPTKSGEEAYRAMSTRQPTHGLVTPGDSVEAQRKVRSTVDNCRTCPSCVYSEVHTSRRGTLRLQECDNSLAFRLTAEVMRTPYLHTKNNLGRVEKKRAHDLSYHGWVKSSPCGREGSNTFRSRRRLLPISCWVLALTAGEGDPVARDGSGFLFLNTCRHTFSPGTVSVGAEAAEAAEQGIRSEAGQFWRGEDAQGRGTGRILSVETLAFRSPASEENIDVIC
ncbi:uncharacterized protein CIMG_13689 [Coccidioides immitis RS]|uniref:Uncharacterized protein n=1 Tax=Coccidioides immitis (strain RS) TaxID=246410 RepID=A0A0D8JYX4_COCIM|nr:uncharacterized protein CIMG_13689 [Coccidioides immitis RS]KJF61468.1 hypothetical protein CIMG_13689 [Coccidioides immitis RS]